LDEASFPIAANVVEQYKQTFWSIQQVILKYSGLQGMIIQEVIAYSCLSCCSVSCCHIIARSTEWVASLLLSL